MSFYDKKILYLDYFKNGEKIKNAGFAKIEVLGEDCRILLNIKSTCKQEHTYVDMILFTQRGEIAVDHFLLNYGTGTYLIKYQKGNMAECGISYEECYGIGVRVDDTSTIHAFWRDDENTSLIKFSEETAIEETALEETVEKENFWIEERMEEEPKDKKEMVELNTNMMRENSYKRKGTLVYDNKWEQLENMFEKIQPFHDERTYLSIKPENFVVLTKEYLPLVNNSFLLHGYYNYKYLILGKERKGEEEHYYIGVPGVYYEEEKQVALMFGFEAFEGEIEGLRDGGFGYYMKQVQI